MPALYNGSRFNATKLAIGQVILKGIVAISFPLNFCCLVGDSLTGNILKIACPTHSEAEEFGINGLIIQLIKPPK